MAADVAAALERLQGDLETLAYSYEYPAEYRSRWPADLALVAQALAARDAALKALRIDYVELEGLHCDRDDSDCCGACHHALKAQLAEAQAHIAALERLVSPHDLSPSEPQEESPNA